MTKKRIFPVLLLFVSVFVLAQSTNFTQFDSAPLKLNAALTGVESKHRVMLNYREQWPTVLQLERYRSYSVAYDARFCSQGNFWSLGGVLIQERAGRPAFNTSLAQISAAYHHKIGKNGHLSEGLSAGLRQYRLGREGLTFNQQFDGYDFDTGMDSGENLTEGNILLPVFGVGLFYYNTDIKELSRRHTSLKIGFSIQHFNRPSFSFFENVSNSSKAQLGALWTLHGGMEFPVTNHGAIVPRFLFMAQELAGDSPHRMGLFMIGWRHKFSLFGHDKTMGLISTGARLAGRSAVDGRRNGLVFDAVPFSLQIGNEKRAFTFSYDMNVSPLRASSGYTGAFEVSVRMNFGEDDCPYCPRY